MRDEEKVLRTSVLLALCCLAEGLWLGKQLEPFIEPRVVPSAATSLILLIVSVFGLWGVLYTVSCIAYLITEWLARKRPPWFHLGNPRDLDLARGDKVYMVAHGVIWTWLAAGTSEVFIDGVSFVCLVILGSIGPLILVIKIRKTRSNVPGG